MSPDPIPAVETIEEFVDPDLLGKFAYAFLRKNLMIPLRDAAGNVVMACADPLTVDVGEIREILRQGVRLARAAPEAILENLERSYYHPSSSQKIIDDLSAGEDGLADLKDEITGDSGNLLDLANKAPVIRLVNQIIYRAFSMRATDIHLQTTETAFKVRYRIDGVLHDIFVLPRKYQPAIVSRIKIISDLDIAEKRVPQDGRTAFKVDGGQLDIRVSIIPTFYGESVVMRLLNKSAFVFRLDRLGLTGTTFDTFNRLIRYDHGIILLTGPTGSGKTTTLYAALAQINKPNINIVTLEDPVEYDLEGINQIQVNPRAGLTFATGLRSILRHDPDIIMVGEIRDPETAEMAVQASLTGHIVFSTLHTNDASSAVTRLLDMGIQPYLIASSLIGVIAQRLVGVNCPECSAPAPPPDIVFDEMTDVLKRLPDPVFRAGPGCAKCLETGYYGRTGIFELLLIDEGIRSLIMERASSADIKKAAVARGLRTLRVDGAEKVASGATSISEVLRVTQET